MIRLTLLAGAAALCLSPLAFAQSYNSNCERIKDDQALVGGLIGAVAGGVLGAAIADDGDDYRHRGYRGHHGHRGYRHHGYRHNNDGDEVAGALIGGVLGAVVGAGIASSGTDCTPAYSSYSPRVETYGYGDVPSPTRLPYGPAWNSQPNGAPSAPQPVNYGYGQQPLYGGESDVPAAPPPPPTQTPGPAQPVYAPECQSVQRETRLPDGGVIREPVEVCRQADGSWEFQQDDYSY